MGIRQYYQGGKAVSGFVPEKAADPGSLYVTGQTTTEKAATTLLREQAKTFPGVKHELTSSGTAVSAFSGGRVTGQASISGGSQ